MASLRSYLTEEQLAVDSVIRRQIRDGFGPLPSDRVEDLVQATWIVLLTDAERRDLTVDDPSLYVRTVARFAIRDEIRKWHREVSRCDTEARDMDAFESNFASADEVLEARDLLARLAERWPLQIGRLLQARLQRNPSVPEGELLHNVRMAIRHELRKVAPEEPTPLSQFLNSNSLPLVLNSRLPFKVAPEEPTPLSQFLNSNSLPLVLDSRLPFNDKNDPILDSSLQSEEAIVAEAFLAAAARSFEASNQLITQITQSVERLRIALAIPLINEAGAMGA